MARLEPGECHGVRMSTVLELLVAVIVNQRRCFAC